MSHHHPHRSNSMRERDDQYVGPYKLEKTLGKGQTGRSCFLCVSINFSQIACLIINALPNDKLVD